jgi:hypothetical protein
MAQKLKIKLCSDIEHGICWFKTMALYEGADYAVLEYPFHVLSIDPGTSGLCIRVEERTSFDEAVTLLYRKYDFSGEKEDSKRQSLANYISLCHCIFEENRPLIMKCKLLLVEEQLQINYNMMRLSSDIISLLLTWFAKVRPAPWIGEIQVNLKSYFLSGKKLKRELVKAMSLKYALQTLTRRGDKNGLNYINSIRGVKAKHDPADTVTQIDAAFRYLFSDVLFDGDIWIN